MHEWEEMTRQVAMRGILSLRICTVDVQFRDSKLMDRENTEILAGGHDSRVQSTSNPHRGPSSRSVAT